MSDLSYKLTEVMTVVSSIRAYANATSDAIPKRKRKKEKKLSYIPEWVNDRIKIGNLSENIAYIYLADISRTDVQWESLTNDSAGYDFIVGDTFYEVKTVSCTDDNFSFYISANEIMSCLKYKDKYKLLCIHIDSLYTTLSSDSISMFIITDLYRHLNKHSKRISQDVTTRLVTDNPLIIIDTVKVVMHSAVISPIQYHFADKQLKQLNIILTKTK